MLEDTRSSALEQKGLRITDMNAAVGPELQSAGRPRSVDSCRLLLSGSLLTGTDGGGAAVTQGKGQQLENKAELHLGGDEDLSILLLPEVKKETKLHKENEIYLYY